MINRRVEKVNVLIKKLLAGYIQKEFCTTRQTIISVTGVQTTANIFESKVFISVFPNEDRAGIVKSLNANIGEFQHFLNKKMQMRPVPKITFIEDKNPQAAQEVETLLTQIADEKSKN